MCGIFCEITSILFGSPSEPYFHLRPIISCVQSFPIKFKASFAKGIPETFSTRTIDLNPYNGRDYCEETHQAIQVNAAAPPLDPC
jgi:hypothetical protein